MAFIKPDNGSSEPSRDSNITSMGSAVKSMISDALRWTLAFLGPGYSATDAEIVFDSFLEASLRGLMRNFDPSAGDFKPYFRTALARFCMDWKIRHPVTKSLDDSVSRYAQDYKPNAFDLLVAKERWDEYEVILKRFSSTQQGIARDHFCEEVPISVLADRYGVTRGYVSVVLCKVRRAFAVSGGKPK